MHPLQARPSRLGVVSIKTFDSPFVSVPCDILSIAPSDLRFLQENKIGHDFHASFVRFMWRQQETAHTPKMKQNSDESRDIRHHTLPVSLRY
ncbi:unnamed protein product [Microthlaspi erraticum]|uniref:Uncharacterized protein n=1 Tax=Microthlaspi erraticum TaxID=1685480 RepID=A0A6D2KMC6_9BRAS|nr:unnamed protein product [Microthlaspi erraticum]